MTNFQQSNSGPSKDEDESALAVNSKDQIYFALKADIVRCNLKPGTAVSEAKLAARYEVGKAPIRDALARLGHEGLVISQARKGRVIAPITIRDVIDLYGVRMALEPVAARLAAGKVDEARLRQAAGACDLPVSGRDPDGISNFLSANSEFHRSIARASGNRRLAKHISNLLDETERVRHVMMVSTASRRDAISEHVGLVEALVSGNRDKAEKLAKDHIQRGWRMVLSSLLSQFQFMDLNIGGPLDDVSSEVLHQNEYSGSFEEYEENADLAKLVSDLGDEQLDGNPDISKQPHREKGEDT